MERREYQHKRSILLNKLNSNELSSEQCGEKLKLLTKIYKESHEVMPSVERCPKCNRDIYFYRKQEYIDLRMKGMSYKKISDVFGISVNALRTIRNSWNIDADIDNW